MRQLPFRVLLMALALWPIDQAAIAQSPKTSLLDAFGDPLPAGALARIGTTKYRTWNQIETRMSPDGKWMTASERPGEIDVWELPAWKNRRVLRPDAGAKEELAALTNLAFNSDGSTLAAFDFGNQRIVLFDLVSGKCTRILGPVDKTSIHSLEIAFAVDKKRIVTVGFHNNISGNQLEKTRKVSIWDLENNKLKRNFEMSAHGAYAISTDCRWLAAAPAQEGDIELLDLATEKKVRSFAADCNLAPLAFSPDGKQLVTAGQTCLRIYGVANGKELVNHRLPSRADHCTFTPDGKSFYLYDSRPTITRWNAETLDANATYPCPSKEYVRQIAFTAKGNVVALAHAILGPFFGARQDFWDVETGKMLSPSGVPSSKIWRIRFSEQGEIYVDSYKEAAWWNPHTGGKIRDHTPIAKQTRAPFGLGWSYFDNNTQAASVSTDILRIWNAQTGRETAKFVLPLEPKESAEQLSVSPNGNYFAISTSQQRLLLWNKKKEAIVRKWKTDNQDRNPGIFSPDNRWLAIRHAKNRLELIRLDRTTADVITEFEKDQTAYGSPVFSPDGRQLACVFAAKQGCKVCLIETASGKMGRELGGDPGFNIDNLAFSHDGGLLAGASHPTTVLVWQTGLR